MASDSRFWHLFTLKCHRTSPASDRMKQMSFALLDREGTFMLWKFVGAKMGINEEMIKCCSYRTVEGWIPSRAFYKTGAAAIDFDCWWTVKNSPPDHTSLPSLLSERISFFSKRERNLSSKNWQYVFHSFFCQAMHYRTNPFWHQRVVWHSQPVPLCVYTLTSLKQLSP